MEDSDSLMLKDMFEPLRPDGPLVMKEEYRENFAIGLKAEIPELFPTVRIIKTPDGTIYFKSPTHIIGISGEYFIDMLILNLNDDGWNVMPFFRHKQTERKVMNTLRKIYFSKGRDVRNTRLMAARMNLPHGPESIIASQLSGLPGNAAEQNDELGRQFGMQGPSPNRKQYSGRRKTLRRKNLRSSRKR
jgi:hypothetical protein